MSVDLCFTTDSSFFFFFFFFLSFFRRLIFELTERNWTKINNHNLKTHVQNLGYPLPLQMEGPNTTFFGRLRNLTPLMATLTDYILGMKRDINNR